MSSDYQKKDSAGRPAHDAAATAESIKRAMARQEKVDQQTAAAHERRHEQINRLSNRGFGVKSRKS